MVIFITGTIFDNMYCKLNITMYPYVLYDISTKIKCKCDYQDSNEINNMQPWLLTGDSKETFISKLLKRNPG